ncbi:MAG TPA: hypothetical protein VFE47_17540 [Tepidisphaeraceae bacterium]|jgi:hypothetical protein|nr:hypothetical protein [Tepidisphaeraceae bacterium]
MQRPSLYRRFQKAALALALGAIVSSASAASAADQAYSIKIHVNPGEKWAFDASTAMNEKGQVLANEQVAQPINQAFTQRRKGVIEVLSVENGLPSAIKLTYDAESSNGGAPGAQQPPPFALAGRTVNVSRRNGVVTTDLGNNVDPQTLQEVSHMLDPDVSAYPKQPVAINEEWDGDTAAMAKAYQLGADDKLTMKCKLLEVHDVAGRQVAEIGLHGTMLKHDEGFIETNITFDGNASIDLQTGQATATTMTGKISMRGAQQQTGPDGTPVKINVSADGDLKVNQTVKLEGAGAPAAPGAGFGIANPPPAAPLPMTPVGDGPFTGKYKGDQVALDLSDAGGQVTGTLTVGDKKFPLAGKSDGGKLTGNFESDGTKFNFTAALDGTTLTLTSEGNTYTLKKPAVNPLARPQAKNPLAKPDAKNPLADPQEKKPQPKNPLAD